MAWYEDLQPWTYLPLEADRPLVAVGWLERGRSYATGEADEELRAALRILYSRDESRMQLKYDTSSFFSGGSHPCDFCDKERNGPRGYSNMFIPSERVIYVCNDLIKHYIEAHHYVPPRPFVQALLKEPSPVEFSAGWLEWQRQRVRALRGEA
ncbi:MAG: hypothetical protein ACTHLN_01780 [Tepidisphaeraceae bacterium]